MHGAAFLCNDYANRHTYFIYLNKITFAHLCMYPSRAILRPSPIIFPLLHPWPAVLAEQEGQRSLTASGSVGVFPTHEWNCPSGSSVIHAAGANSLSPNLRVYLDTVQPPDSPPRRDSPRPNCGIPPNWEIPHPPHILSSVTSDDIGARFVFR